MDDKVTKTGKIEHTPQLVQAVKEIGKDGRRSVKSIKLAALVGFCFALVFPPCSRTVLTHGIG